MQEDLIGNRYKKEKILGQGGMGRVFLVSDTLKAGPFFALKTIRQDLISKHRKLGIDSFKNEYEIMTRLKHPNLTRVYDFGVYEGNYYIVMEYLEGVLLSDINIQDADTLMDIVVQILRALGFIHSRYIIYRDIKPTNIIIVEKRVKLLDFGLSGLIYEKDEKIRGTILYMAPESFTGRIGFNADIFSLGIVFYELLTKTRFYGQKVLSKKALFKILRCSNEFDLYKERVLRSVKNEEMKKIISKMISFCPEDRYQNCSEIIDDINKGLNHSFEIETRDTSSSYVLGNAFANRTAELARLKENIKEDYAGALIYSGTSGLGKTRLFDEFKKYCRLNGILFFDINCIEGESRQYHAITDLLKYMANISSGTLLKTYGKFIKLLLPFNKRLQCEDDLDLHDDPKILQDIIIQNITDYIIDFSKGQEFPVIIYFNDFQWIDDGSEKILRNILNRFSCFRHELGGLFIYANINEVKLHKETRIREIFSMDCVKKFEIHPLDVKASRELIGNIFGVHFIGPKLKEAIGPIREKVGGNPLFLQELIKSLIQGEIIKRERVFWNMSASIDSVLIPQNILDIVNDKLSRLFKDNNTRKVLEIMSLLRIDLNIETIRSILNKINVLNSTEILIQLEYHEIIVTYTIEGDMFFSISSDIMKEAVRGFIGNKIELSLFLAESLESFMEADDHEYLEEIAYHYLQSKCHEKAGHYYEICGDISQNSYFNQKALKYYNTALNIVRDIKKETSLLMKIGNIYELIGNWDDAVESYESAYRSAEMNRDYISKADCLNKIATVLQSMGEIEKAHKAISNSLSISHKIGHRTGINNSTGFKAILYFLQGQYKKALYYHKKHMRISREINDKKGISASYANIGILYHYQGKYKKAMEYYKKLLKISKNLKDKRTLAYAIGNMGVLYDDQGDYDQALIYYRKYLALSKQIGHKSGISHSKGNMGVAYYNKGDYTKSMHCYRDNLRLCHELGDKFGIGYVVGNMGLIYKDLGDFDQAMACFEKKLAIAKGLNDKSSIGYALGNIASLFMNMGNLEKADNFLEQSLEIMQELGNSYCSSWLLYSKAGILYKKKQYNGSLDFNEQALKIAMERNYKDLIINCKLLMYKINEDPEGLLSMLKLKDINQEQMALINYELWKMTKKNSYKDIAIGIYNKLYSKTPKYEYKKIIDKDLQGF